MKFVELSSSEFEKASNNFPGSSFYQSYAWTKIKELTGWKHYFVGVLRDNKLVAISLIIGKKVYFDKYLYYAPREGYYLIIMILNYLAFLLRK